jgi:predicted CXXCH cytochrome family protein
LAVSVNQICADCHDEMGEDHHYLDADAADEYPDGNFPTVGDKLSCIGCHNPHAADEGALFAGPEDTLCSSCH